MKYKHLTILLIVLVLLSLGGCHTAAEHYNNPPIVNGNLNLSHWDFEKNGIIPLNGQWEFYWKKLIDKDKDKFPSIIYGQVPGTWEHYHGESKLPSVGFASYRIVLSNYTSKQPLAIYLTSAATAYKLYVDGCFVGSNGSFNSSGGNIIPEVKPQSITIGSGQIHEIVIQVANDVYARGGLWFQPYLGQADDIQKFSQTFVYKDFFLLGGLFIIGLYYIIIFQFNRNKKEYLYFAILCFAVSLRIMVYGSYLMIRLFPNLPYRIVVITIYATLYWVPAIFLKMVKEIFYPNKINIGIKAVLWYAVAVSIFTLFAPIKLFTGFASVFEVIAFFILLYSLYFVLKAFKSGMTGSKIILTGTILVFAALIYDVLYHKNYVFHSFGPISPLVYFVFALLISVLLAKRYFETFSKIKILNTELKEMNTLKTQVYETKLALLQAQIKPHFLFNSMNVIATLCKMDTEKARELTLDLSNYLQISMNFNELPKQIKFSKELDLVHSYINIEKARFRDKLTVNYKLEHTEEFYVPPLILQPIVENAIRHGIRKKRSGGTVTIKTKEEPSCYWINVEDDGLGMTQEQIQEILNQEVISGKNGIGLPNVNRRLKELYGTQLLINSSSDRGTLVSMKIPKVRGLGHESCID